MFVLPYKWQLQLSIGVTMGDRYWGPKFPIWIETGREIRKNQRLVGWLGVLLDRGKRDGNQTLQRLIRDFFAR